MGYNFDSNAIILHRMLEARDLVKAIFCSVVSEGFLFNFGDGGEAKQVSFCSVEPEACLVPDSEFFAKEGYSEARDAFRKQPEWTVRSSYPYWRGSSTGFRDDDGILSLPRVKLCLLCNALGYDAKITQAYQCRNESEKSELVSAGVMGTVSSWADALHMRYNIDIDGNTSAWSSLFIKLLAGGVVLKVASPSGFRQWYYDRLVPWENFVPIRSDFCDLAQTVERLENDPVLAATIAANGRNLALSMTVESEVAIAIERIKKFVPKTTMAAFEVRARDR